MKRLEHGILNRVLGGLLLSVSVLAGQEAEIVEKTGIAGGFVIHLGCGDGTLATAFSKRGKFIACGLDDSPSQIDEARKIAAMAGGDGKAFFSVLQGDKLPFIDNLANLVVAEEPRVDESEIMRVLCPGGKAVIGGEVVTKPWPEEISDWTHYLNRPDNNAVSSDRRVGPPRHVQWVSHPKWSRHHDKLASISTIVTGGGKLFFIQDEGSVVNPDNPASWSLAARDAFNGVLLWKQPISSWVSHQLKFRSGPVQLQRLLVTDGDRVYAPLGLDAGVSVLDADTGDVLKTIEGTEHVEEILLSDGTLIALTGHGAAEQAAPNLGKAGKVPDKLIKVVDPETGSLLWQYPKEGAAAIHPRTLTVADGAVFVQEGDTAVCFDLAGGRQRWRTGPLSKAKKGGLRSVGWTFNAFSYSDGVLLCAVNNTDLVAVDAATGRTRWNTQAKTVFGKTPEVEVYAIDGVVWSAPDFSEGRDLKTGEILTRNQLQENLVTSGHHHRCYRGKATGRYIIQGYRGLEFRDTQGSNHVRHNWLRGICQYGILPANGQVYVPPHNCGCYFEAKLYGFWSMVAAQSRFEGDGLEPSTHLEKGPAYGSLSRRTPGKGKGWPMYRHDAMRSGSSAGAVPRAPEQAWNIKLAAAPTQPVVSGDLVAVAIPEHNTVLACSTNTGETLWRFNAPAKVDSSPTFHRDALIFGCRDGYVYCLKAKTGALAWRFRAAPMDLRTIAFDGVESVWPVHGSVLIHEDRLLFVAGRSTYLDGGLFLYELNPLTGEVLRTSRMHSEPARVVERLDNGDDVKVSQNKADYKTRIAPDRSDAFSMQGGNISDILTAKDGRIYLRHVELDTKLGASGEWSFHLYSTSRFIDDNEAHRSHFFFGQGDHSLIPVAYEWLLRRGTRYGGFQVPAGKLLVFDDESVWGTPAHATWNGAIKVFDLKGAGPLPGRDFGLVGRKAGNSSDSKERAAGAVPVRDLGGELPFHARALAKAGDAIIVGGYPNSAKRPLFYNKPTGQKGQLQIMSASTGEVLQTMELPAPPRFDGISVAAGAIYVACEDGGIVCLK